MAGTASPLYWMAAKNPFIPLLRFTVGTGLEIVPKHQLRHLLQVERVKQAEDFPDGNDPPGTGGANVH